jgi:hypothetical protein
MIEFSTELPRVLSAPNPDNSISMLRALKQIKLLLEQVDVSDDTHADRIAASLDDIETMLAAIK